MYAFREAVLALFRHPVSSLATLTTATVSFTLLFIAGMALWNLDRAIGAAEGELEVAAFLSPGTSASVLLDEVRGWPEVAEVRLIDKAQALKTLKEAYPYLRKASELVANPLPDTLILRLKNPQAVGEVARRLADLAGVDDVEYGGAFTLKLLQISRTVRSGAIALILLLILNTFFSVMGTIRLSIENRREELEVMQLVGATRGMVLAPFVLEGLLLTLVAALVSLAVGILAYRYLSQNLQALFPFLPILGPSDLLIAAEALLALAAFLGVVGGWLSSRAHLKEVEG